MIEGEAPLFDDPAMLAWLEAADTPAPDRLPFGAIRIDHDGRVAHYNATESRHAGLSPAKVVGRPFFATVARCTDNAVVAGRYAAEPELDVIIRFAFTPRMRPTPVRLRLLQSAAFAHRYLLVQRRA